MALLPIAGTWVDGAISSTDGEQYFMFTATAPGTQYIHIERGTLTDLHVELRDSGDWLLKGARFWDGNTIARIYGQVTSGRVYYVKVTPYSASDSGTYRIAFNTSSTPPQ